MKSDPSLKTSILISPIDLVLQKGSNFDDSLSELDNIGSNLKTKIESSKILNDFIDMNEIKSGLLQGNKEELLSNRQQKPLTLSSLKDEDNDNSNKIDYLCKKNKGLEVINRLLRQENEQLKKKKFIRHEDFGNDYDKKKYEEKCAELEIAKIEIENLRAENESMIKRNEEDKKDNKLFYLSEGNSENMKELVEENKKLHNFIGIYKEKFNKIVNFVKILEEKEINEEDYKLKIIDLEQKVELLLIENRKLHEAYSTNQ